MLAKLDGRTKEARLMDRARTDLGRHVGGHPTPVQERLIEQVARLTLHVERLDKRALAEGLSAVDARQYRELNSELRLNLRELGVAAAI